MLASFSIALLIRHFIYHRVLRFHAQVLTYLSAAVIALACIEELWQGLAALVIYSAFYLSLIVRRSWVTAGRFAAYYQHAIYMLMLPLAVLVKALTGSWTAISLSLALYCWLILQPWPQLQCVPPSRKVIILYAWGLSSFALMMLSL